MKKWLKISGVIVGTMLLIMIILGLIFFTIDYNRVKNNEDPKFCIKELGVIMDGGTMIYWGLGYKIIDFNTLAGYDKTKIGTWFMEYNDFNEEIKEQEKIFQQEVEKK